LSALEDNVDVMRPTDRQTLGSQTVTHRYVRVSKHESFQQTLTQAYAVGRASARVFHHNIYNELRGHWTTLRVARLAIIFYDMAYDTRRL